MPSTVVVVGFNSAAMKRITMGPTRESSVESHPTRAASTRRRALLGTAGMALSALAGCLGLGAQSSGSSDNSSTKTGTGTGDTLPAPVQGDPQANVTVAVYEDFACPHCQTYNFDVLPQLESEYIESGTIRYEHHDFPIPVDDPQSYYAANAARAVQDRAGDEPFWTYAQLLFENQSSLGTETYASLASEMDLDGTAISDAAANRTYESTVMGDRQQGIDRGVNATPTVFVAGNAVSEPTFSAISSAIESAK